MPDASFNRYAVRRVRGNKAEIIAWYRDKNEADRRADFGNELVVACKMDKIFTYEVKYF